MKDRNPAVEVMRCLAIMSVALAHYSGKVYETYTGGPLFIFKIFKVLGTVGVVVFFIISGYYYHREKDDTPSFWKKKLAQLILPALFCGVISYTMLNLREFRFIGMIVYCYGGGSWLYYVTVLLFLLAIFKAGWKNRAFLVVCMAINVISILLFASKLVLYEQLPYPYLTSYLLPTNWIGFFALGVFLRRSNFFDRAADKAKRYWYVPLTLFCLATVLHAYFGYDAEISYFVFASIPYELLAFLTVYCVSEKLARFRLPVYIGNCSFFIYLYHINILGFISNRFCCGWYLTMLYPFLIEAALCMIVFLLNRVWKAANFDRRLLNVLGIR